MFVLKHPNGTYYRKWNYCNNAEFEINLSWTGNPRLARQFFSKKDISSNILSLCDSCHHMLRSDDIKSIQACVCTPLEDCLEDCVKFAEPYATTPEFITPDTYRDDLSSLIKCNVCGVRMPFTQYYKITGRVHICVYCLEKIASHIPSEIEKSSKEIRDIYKRELFLKKVC